MNPEFIQMMSGSGSKLKIIGLLSDLLPTEAFDLLGQMLASPITQKLEKGDAETASIIMSQQIKNGLMSGLTSRLGRSLIDPLSQTIVETVTETIVLGIQARVSSTVTASVTEALTRDLSRDVAETLPVKLNRMVPGHLTRSLLRDATHVLTNSISHSWYLPLPTSYHTRLFRIIIATTAITFQDTVSTAITLRLNFTMHSITRSTTLVTIRSTTRIGCQCYDLNFMS